MNRGTNSGGSTAMNNNVLPRYGTKLSALVVRPERHPEPADV